MQKPFECWVNVCKMLINVALTANTEKSVSAEVAVKGGFQIECRINYETNCLMNKRNMQ